MVALAIGLFGSIIMMQVFSLSEQNKRTTTSGGDAMNEGVMALYAIQRDVRMGGYGVADTRLLGCDVLLRSGVTLNALAPVTINHASITGQDANTDTLLVVYGNTNGMPQGDAVKAANVVQTPYSFAANDWVIESKTTACGLTLDQITAVTVVGSTGTLTLRTGASMTDGSTLFNLGQNLKVVAYAVRNGNMTMCDYTINNCGNAADNNSATVWVPIADNIVSLRAQYGRDTTTPMDGIVDTYDQTSPATACDWARASAIRLALVARSTQPSDSATSTAPVWDGSFLSNGTTVAAPITLSGNTSWQNYRYKVFQTVVPVRNVSWMGVVSTC